jgi:hypothetical protein
MRHALALALLCGFPVLAGCLATPPTEHARPAGTFASEAHLAVVGGSVNQQATADPATRKANELSIAINPRDPQNIIATGKDYTQPYAGNCVWDGIYVTHDGGATWDDGNLLGSPWKAQADVQAGQPPQLDQQLSKFYCATDPAVEFGPDGTAYWAVMPYQCDPGTGSSTGSNVGGSGQGIPPGGFNDWMWSCSSMYVLASKDGGTTWTTVSEVDFGPRLKDDKEWIAVSPTNKVLLCWDQDAWVSSAPSSLYAALTQDSPAPAYPVPSGTIPDEPVPSAVVCSTSDNHAATWTATAVATNAGFTPWVDFSSDGTAHMAVVDGHHVLYLNSKDGLAWSPPVVVGNYTDPQSTLMNGFTALNGSAFRAFATSVLAVDRSGGPDDGAIYITWMDATGNRGRTMVSSSHDGGKTWGTPVWVHDATARGDQFMPAVNVGPDGTVDLCWMDRRDDVQMANGEPYFANHLFNLYYAYSLDGGATWSDNLRVSTNSSDEKYSHHQNGAVFLGDYIDIASAAGAAHPVWVDTRHMKPDAYTATILRPGANAKMAAAASVHA